MARNRRRRPVEGDAEPAAAPGPEPEVPEEPDEPQGDSSFEAAQLMLQAAVAEIRGFEVTEPVDPGGADEIAHRRWRRRMHAEGHSGEHRVVSQDAVSDPGTLLEPAADDAGASNGARDAGVAGATAVVAELLEGDAPEGEILETAETAEIEVGETAAIAETADTADAPEVEAGDAAAGAAVAGIAAASTTDPPTAPPKTRGRRRRGPRPATVAAATAAGAAAAATDAPTDELDEVAAATAAATQEHRAPRRRTGAGTPSTISSPTAGYVIAIEQAAAAPGGDVEEVAPATSGRGRRILVASLAAIIAIAAIGFVVTTSGSDDEVASPPAKVQARLAFEPVTTPEGVTVARVWKLQGTDGDSLRGRLAYTNPTSAPVTTTFTEVIPKSLASNVSAITFDPQPVVVKADPIVQYTVTVDPGDTFVATYTVAVPATGATRERLLKWAEDLRAEVGTTTTTTLPPTTTTTTAAPPATSTPTVTTPATLAPNPTTTTVPPTTTTAPPANGSYSVAVFNNSGDDALFFFSNGVVLNVPGYQQGSSGLITVPSGVHSVTLDNGTTGDISCSAPTPPPPPGPTANIVVPPGGTANCIWTAVP